MKPNKIQIVVEIIYEGIESFINQITGNKIKTNLLFPFIGALFIFIMASNLLGLIPGLTSITWNNMFILRPPTSDFNTTFSLAAGAILIIQLISIKEIGFFGYLGKFFKFKEIYLGFRNGISSGLIAIINFLVGLLDIVGEFAKVISLSLRLFGNIYAGIVLTTTMFAALAYVLPSIWTGLGLFFGIIQAIVFSALVAAYYTLSVETKNDDNL